MAPLSSSVIMTLTTPLSAPSSFESIWKVRPELPLKREGFAAVPSTWIVPATVFVEPPVDCSSLPPWRRRSLTVSV